MVVQTEIILVMNGEASLPFLLLAVGISMRPEMVLLVMFG